MAGHVYSPRVTVETLFLRDNYGDEPYTMRPFEMLLILIDAIALVQLLLYTPWVVRLLRFKGSLPLVAAAIQLLVEGYRWQMLPAYLLALLLTVFGLLIMKKPAGDPLPASLWRRPLKITAGVVCIPLMLSSVALPLF